MQKDQTPPAGAAEPAAMAQANLQQLTEASERFMKGVVDASVRQIELSRSLIEGGLEDFQLLALARTPEALVHAEFDVLRRRSERMISAMQKASDDLTQTWSKAIEMTQSSASAAAAKRQN
jgi:hypothetical protein